MELLEFARHQERVVRARAAKVCRYMVLCPVTNAEALARRELATIAELRGVSLGEFMGEVLLPGSFSILD